MLPKYEVLKFLSGGNEQLLADCWWLAFIQYYGDVANRKKDNNKYAFDYLDLITRLDPKFTQPYWFAAFAVGAEAQRPDLAREIIDRGIAANPDNWYIPFIAGINEYLFGHNDKEAAHYYRLASRHPDAPAWIARQARILDAEIPSFYKELNSWGLIYEKSNDEIIREQARGKLISMLIELYKVANNPAARERALGELKLLNVNIETLERLKKE